VQRVVVVGPGGAGKTFVAERLSERTGIPVIYLDRIFWRSEWRPTPRGEAVTELERALTADRWIVDGNFLDAGDTRFQKADTVIFLDLPRPLCIARIVWRRVRDHGKERPDLPAPEGLDWEFIKWTWRYPHELWLPNVLHLRSRREVAEMIRSVG
jgi:adenylate kinase family enzyme